MAREPISGVYKIVHKESGTTYVGSSQDVRERWTYHKWQLRTGRHDNSHLQHAWDKYGEEAFEFSLIEEVLIERLLDVEQVWLDRCTKSEAGVYNIAMDTSAPMRGRHATADTKAKMRTAMMGNRYGLGYRHAAEAKAKIIAALTGRIVSEETRRKLSEAHTGKHLSEETRRKLSESHRGQRQPRSKETKCRIAEANGKPYPAFVHADGSIIPAGSNLSAMCRERGLTGTRMSEVKSGKWKSHKGWMLLAGEE